MIVMDTSAAVEIVRQTEIGAALAIQIDPEEEVIAPTWLKAELRNVFWKYVRAGFYTEEVARQRITCAEQLVTRFVSEEDYLEEAFAEAVRRDHPFYDMLYLCMTRRCAGVLFSTDKKLIDICTDARVNAVEVIKL
jgi:predicted nucleic acid-binding protein